MVIDSLNSNKRFPDRKIFKLESHPKLVSIFMLFLCLRFISIVSWAHNYRRCL